MTQMRGRVAVYNRYWASRGGGERHSGMLAQVVAREAERVDLIAHAEIDRDGLADYLGLDLSACHVRVVPDSGDADLADLSAEYDLFVNASYMSRIRPKAARSIYLCYFPTPADHDLSAWRRWLVRTVGGALKPPEGAIALRWGTGWFPPEGGRRRRWIWTNGSARLDFAAGPEHRIRFQVARLAGPPTSLRVSVNGADLVRVEAGARFTPVEVRVPAAGRRREVTFASDTFVPGGSDPRSLGVAVSRLRLSGASFDPRVRAAIRFPWLLRNPRDLAFLDAYDVVLANSRYTAEWIARLWQRESEIVYPPIQVDRFAPAAARAPAIVSAGRFFAPGQGHSKRQLELVRTFGEIVRSGRLAEWRLHLVGGCEPSQERYLAQVRAAAEGLPVEFHVNAPRDELEALMATCAVQWSATGYGEDDRRAPWASEHFGMTTVEAMAGGCVPIVIDKAGQREIVRDGVDGYRWTTLDGLAERTIQVAGDPELRARLSASARERAQQYSDDAFATNVMNLLERHDLL